MSNKITEITKREIIDLFSNGFNVLNLFNMEVVHYNYSGRISEIEFLALLYDLNKMPSFDTRFENAEDEIFHHTVKNNDYQNNWVFTDSRFKLFDGTDELYLKFLCKVFDPNYRFEKGYWEDLLKEINLLLKKDGYELYPIHQISGRDIYGWRIFKNDNSMFIPFSQRNYNLIKKGNVNLKINKRTRYQIIKIIERYDYLVRRSSETGSIYDIFVSDGLLAELSLFYVPQHYNENNEWIEATKLTEFIQNTSPYYVLDVIEMISKYHDLNFINEINSIFELADLSLRLNNGKFNSIFDSQFIDSSLINIQEVGVKELLYDANKYYEINNFEIAVEKMWDALERLKSYYFPSLGLKKKDSITKIINDMSHSNRDFIVLFEKEFKELTDIGNKYRIRHHETDKININSELHYDYLYRRCLTLINTAIRTLNL